MTLDDCGLDVIRVGQCSPVMGLLSDEDRMLCLCDEMCLGFFAVEIKEDGKSVRVAPDEIEFDRESGNYIRRSP